MKIEDEDGNLTPEGIAFLRRGIHRLGCVPRLPNRASGRNRPLYDLMPEMGDKTGDYPCLCSSRPIKYNGHVIPPYDEEV